MFLHAGAGIHKHEFSTPPDHSQLPKRPSIRSAFSTPIQRSATTYENSISATVPPQKPLSEHRRRSIPQEHIVRFQEPIVRFQEPEVDRMSEDARSIANSDTSETTAGGRGRRRRTPRTSTAYHLAHPAPTLAIQKQKLLQVRPKLLLQLQQLSNDSRPKPAIDVLPSFLVVPRLSKKFPRIFRGQGELGANDVMIVKSEDYDAPYDHSLDGQESDDECLASRNLIAVICQMRKGEGGSQGCAEITLHDESVWTATPLMNGSFEFTTMDSTGFKTIARWVRKAPRGEQSAVGSADYKYNFSLIDPNSRRHPIMASITQRTLDIPDFYTSVSRSAGKYPPTSPMPATPDEPEVPLPNDEAIRTSHAIDESTKTLIQVTGVWVALRQGWSPYFKYNDLICGGAPTNPRAAVHGRVRSLSLTPEASQPSPSGNGSASPDSGHNTFGPIGKVRRSCLNPITSRGSPSAGSPQMQQSLAPKRASSAGTAFMQRAVARRGNAPSTVASDSEGEGGLRFSNHPGTENMNEKSANRMSMPPLTLPGWSNSTLDTPTKPRRRVQSAIYPSTKLQNGHLSGDGLTSSPESVDGKHASDWEEKSKTSRWKSFTNLFRRSNRRTNGSDENGSPN